MPHPHDIPMPPHGNDGHRGHMPMHHPDVLPDGHTAQLPRIAIIDSNTLATMGLKQLLAQFMPFMQIDTFAAMDALLAPDAPRYFHYFVAMPIAIAHRSFFLEHPHQTIVLTEAASPSAQMSGFRSLCISQPEDQLVRSLIMLAQQGHAGGRNLPAGLVEKRGKALTAREVEVLSLVAQGKINKQIADQLCIGLTTVITHRKNIQEKLGIKSVSALTIYAVMHGYVDVNLI